MPQLPGKYYLSVAVITANSGRYPISAQCEVLGVPRPACCGMRGRGGEPKRPDPLTPEVVLADEANRCAYGARKMKAALERRGFCASRRRIGRIMRGNDLVSAHSKAKFKAHADRLDEAEPPNIVAREFDGPATRTRIVSDVTYVRAGSKWNYACLLVDLCNREIVGHAAGERKDARLVKSAFATVASPPDGHPCVSYRQGRRIRQHRHRRPPGGLRNRKALSRKGCPYDNAVDASTNKILKTEFVYRESFSTLHELQVKLNDYVHWYNHFRLHSKLGYVSPVEFRNAGLSL